MSICMYAGPALGGAGTNWEQFQSAQVPSQHTPRSGSIWSNWLKADPVGMYVCVCMCVFYIFEYILNVCRVLI